MNLHCDFNYNPPINLKCDNGTKFCPIRKGTLSADLHSSKADLTVSSMHACMYIYFFRAFLAPCDLLCLFSLALSSLFVLLVLHVMCFGEI